VETRDERGVVGDIHKVRDDTHQQQCVAHPVKDVPVTHRQWRLVDECHKFEYDYPVLVIIQDM
jgi:hypothetical protein